MKRYFFALACAVSLGGCHPKAVQGPLVPVHKLMTLHAGTQYQTKGGTIVALDCPVDSDQEPVSIHLISKGQHLDQSYRGVPKGYKVANRGELSDKWSLVFVYQTDKGVTNGWGYVWLIDGDLPSSKLVFSAPHCDLNKASKGLFTEIDGKRSRVCKVDPATGKLHQGAWHAATAVSSPK